MIIARHGMGGYPPSLLTDIVNYWNLDESGTDVSDLRVNSVPGGVSLTPTGTLFTPQEGKSGLSYTLNDSLGELIYDGKIVNGINGVADSYTISAWIRDISNNTAIYLRQEVAGGTNRVFRIASVSNSINVSVTRVVGGIASIIHPATFMANAQFKHVVVTYNKATGILSLRFNNNTPETLYVGNIVLDDDAVFLISGSSDGIGSRVDEVAHWSRVLSDAEITALYNSGTGLFYPFT